LAKILPVKKLLRFQTSVVGQLILDKGSDPWLYRLVKNWQILDWSFGEGFGNPAAPCAGVGINLIKGGVGIED